MIESLKQRGHQRRSCSAQAAAQSKPGLQWSGESGIKEIVLPWEALLLSGILRGCAAQNRAFTPSCSISAIEGKDNSPCLWIGRLTVGQCGSGHDFFSTHSGVNYLPTTKPARRHSVKVSRKAQLT